MQTPCKFWDNSVIHLLLCKMCLLGVIWYVKKNGTCYHSSGTFCPKSCCCFQHSGQSQLKSDEQFVYLLSEKPSGLINFLLCCSVSVLCQVIRQETAYVRLYGYCVALRYIFSQQDLARSSEGKKSYIIVFQIYKTMTRLKENMKRTNYENLTFSV